MRLSDYGLCSVKGKLCFNSTGGRRKQGDRQAVIMHLNENYRVPLKDVEELYIALINLASLEVEESLSEQRNRAISLLNPFKHFSILHNTISDSYIVYYEDSKKKIPICPVHEFDKKQVHRVLEVENPKFMAQIISDLQYLINPKDPDKVSALDALEVCFNTLQPGITLHRTRVNSEIHPVVVQGCKVPSLKIIPFKEQEVTIDSLHPLLKEFLTRVSNHENMCANLWTNLIGIKTPVLIYLKGIGGDGKSQFVRMLGNLCTGMVCNYDWSERFNYFNMYGKALIIMNENKMPNILQHTVLKSITGGDFVQIEAKGKAAFSAEVRGQLIVVANDNLKVFGTPDEARRLRYYEVSPLTISDDSKINPDEYVKIIGSTPNEFLNYLRVCYEKHKTETGAVKQPDNHIETLKSLRDPEIQAKYEEVITALTKGPFTLTPNGSISTIEVIKVVKKIDKNNKYAVENFETLARLDHGIVKNLNVYTGIQKKLFIVPKHDEKLDLSS